MRRNGNGSKLFVESVVVLSDFRVTSKIVVSWWKARTPLGEFVRRVATRSRTCRVTRSGRESLDRAPPPPPPSALSSLLAPGRWHCGGHLSWRFSFVFSHPRISNSVTLASRLPAASIVLRRSVQFTALLNDNRASKSTWERRRCRNFVLNAAYDGFGQWCF